MIKIYILNLLVKMNKILNNTLMKLQLMKNNSISLIILVKPDHRIVALPLLIAKLHRRTLLSRITIPPLIAQLHQMAHLLNN